MSRPAHVYLLLLAGASITWLALRRDVVASLAADGFALAWLVLLYLLSHFVRIIRLGLLTLDRRAMAGPLVSAHVFTAFPSSFLPFKMGEVLRLGAFLFSYDWRAKGLAVWLVERFADVAVLSLFILGLHVFDLNVPSEMRMALIVFVVATIAGLLTLFAVAKVSVYLNRHLVLTSHSRHGLVLLRITHVLRDIERQVIDSVAGRVSGLILTSVLIWVIEIAALSLYLAHVGASPGTFSEMFTSGLLASLSASTAHAMPSFGLYQSVGLAMLTLVCALIIVALARTQTERSYHG